MHTLQEHMHNTLPVAGIAFGFAEFVGVAAGVAVAVFLFLISVGP